MSKKVREMTQFDVGSGGVSSNLEGDAIRNAYAKGAAAEREKSGTTTNGRLSNTDALGEYKAPTWGEYKAPTWNGGAGAGSRSTMENLAKDIYDSSYSKFTEGEDYASLVKRYSAQGRQAMDDTVGQMAARTGGLASSWAASAGQQAYGGWMEKLEDAARSLYDSEFAEKMNKLGVAQGLYDRNYSEFKDNRDFGYGVYQDKVSNNQWQQEFDRSGEQWQYQTEQEAADDFKDSIYDAAYWGNANWADFAKKAGEYDITEEEFTRIVKSAQGARGDDTYERTLAEKETEEDDLYAEIYYGGSYESFAAYKNAHPETQLTEREYNSIITKAQTDSAPTVDNFVKANYLRQTESGNYVFEKGGKEIELEAGINPYTYTRNPDTKHGAFSNGYQPNNVNGNTLSEADYDGELYVNGVKQKVWETSDGQWYYWDGTQNKYIETTKEELDKMSNGE